ncbi:MAG TPA: DoxX family protein [Terriglobales bacterium]|nr:DoxX family protein [Terriglobales bacterium]
MSRSQQPALTLFAVGMIGLGILALIYGDFALVWQPVARWVPGRTMLAYGSGLIMLLGGVGLLLRATATWSIRILFPYLIVWALLKVPALFVAPQREAVWLGLGELTVLLAGGWVLFAEMAGLREGSALAFLTGEKGIRRARILFAVSLLPIGLSHLVYVKETAELVPAWLPYRVGWAYLTGVGQMACGLGVLFSAFPRVAAGAEAGMISLFTLLVWLPAILAAPKTRLPWTAFFISWAIASAAWAVAQSIKRRQAAHPSV